MTPELARKIAEHEATGLPPVLALAREKTGLTLPAWKKLLETKPAIAMAYNETLAEKIQDMLKLIASSNRNVTWTPIAWILERRFHHWFAQQRAGANVNVTVQNCIGLANEIATRSRAFVKDGDCFGEKPVLTVGTKGAASDVTERVPVKELLNAVPA